MNTVSTTINHKQYLLMEKAVNFLADNLDSQPTLEILANYLGQSPTHIQKVFTQWVGISPKRFSQYLSKEYIKNLLDQGTSSLDAAYQAGLSGSGRLHDLFISTEAITPAQYRSLGRDLTIEYGFHHSPFGEYLLGITGKGICFLGFCHIDRNQQLQLLLKQWALANIRHNQEATEVTHQQLFLNNSPPENLSVVLKGTNFQIQVWQALLQIPFGDICHYQKLAELSGNHNGARAVGTAIGSNSIAYLIPCHRVVRKVGETGEYRWGKSRKKLMLAYEASISNMPL